MLLFANVIVRDAGTIHLGVAKYIEVEYAKNLRPFYPMCVTIYRVHCLV